VLISALWALQILHYKLPAFPVNTVLASLWRMGLAALVMTEIVWVVARSIGANSGPDAVLRVVVATLVGTATYVAMLVVLQSPELDDVRSRVRPMKTEANAD
jgi:putative peptidoglycan lipid II flippase